MHLNTDVLTIDRGRRRGDADAMRTLDSLTWGKRQSYRQRLAPSSIATACQLENLAALPT